MLCLPAAHALFAEGLDDLKPVAPVKEPECAQVNEAFGVPLWPSANLWEAQAADVAAALQWPLESRTTTSASYRLYPPKDYQMLGTHPYSIALFADEAGNVSRLSIVFANKGDEKGNY